MMYKVILETAAILDLRGIHNNIANNLKNRQAAQRIFFSIEEKVMTLANYPKRHSVVQDESYKTLCVRRMPVENYTAFYIVDDSEGVVHIIRILYNRREWQNLL